MNASTATSQSVFSLRTSAFNDFLFAPIGEEENGMVLTTLSALARAGVDPWDEAERLSQLPREIATRRLTSMISGLPNGRWAQSATGSIVTRLIALLPAKRDPQAQPNVNVNAQAKPASSVRMITFAIIFLVNALVFSAVRNHEPSRAADQSQSASSTVTSPQVPAVDAK
ncbi:MAG TPA: hypothetical protein VN766_04815 [Stellaceae bacterium]|jgi:hypothetical protein|nr:hypothetical protein [Stellaceae bacterium]